MVNTLKYSQPEVFADDTYIFIFHKDLKNLYSDANEDLQSLSSWLIANKHSLSIGNDKDSRYNIHSNTNLKPNTYLPKFRVGDSEIPRTSNT